MIRFTVPGTPVAKGRPRITTRGGQARAYTPAKTVAYEGLVALAAQDAMAGRPLIQGPVYLILTARFAIPKSWNNRDRAAAATGNVWHVSRPDGDNIAKAVGDALNGVVWGDDSQVALCKTMKVYAETPGLDVEVEPLAGGL